MKEKGGAERSQSDFVSKHDPAGQDAPLHGDLSTAGNVTGGCDNVRRFGNVVLASTPSRIGPHRGGSDRTDGSIHNGA
jgi:hypothetical protein